jgi:hypothetical protein
MNICMYNYIYTSSVHETVDTVSGTVRYVINSVGY